MHFEGEFTINSPREKVWEYISDPRNAVEYVPDIKTLDVASEERFTATLGIGIGGIVGTFKLEFEIVESITPSHVKLKAGPSIDVLPKSYVRVTDRRIIIGQKTLGRKNMYMIRYIIHYTGMTAPDGFAGGALKTGYITYRTIPQEMKIMEDKESTLLIEPYGEKGIGVPQWLEISCSSEYRL